MRNTIIDKANKLIEQIEDLSAQAHLDKDMELEEILEDTLKEFNNVNFL